MKHPLMKIGEFEFHYIQVPYDNRYYVIKYGKYKKKEISKFSPSIVDILDGMIRIAVDKTYYQGYWSEGLQRQVDIFSSNKERYDKYLDDNIIDRLRDIKNEYL